MNVWMCISEHGSVFPEIVLVTFSVAVSGLQEYYDFKDIYKIIETLRQNSDAAKNSNFG